MTPQVRVVGAISAALVVVIVAAAAWVSSRFKDDIEIASDFAARGSGFAGDLPSAAFG